MEIQQSRICKIATFNLNQWAMDFEHNKNNIIASINDAKEAGAMLRMGPELEICGYGCEDHFLEMDTVLHSWDVLAEIIEEGHTDDILVDIGMPVYYKSHCYNCRITIYKRHIYLIRPKIHMSNEGNYRETRYFLDWTNTKKLEEMLLPKWISNITGQKTAKFGVAIIRLNDTEIAHETCQEMFVPENPSVDFWVDGAEIILNGSGSHHFLRKLDKRLQLILNHTSKAGGVYVYSNQQGWDGGRLYFDGSSLIAMNGKVIAQGSQFCINEREMVLATIDLNDIRSFRRELTNKGIKGEVEEEFQRVYIDYDLCNLDYLDITDPQGDIKVHTPQEEIFHGPPLWMWDYLRRSGARGYFLPLSGGLDSASVATMIGSMSNMVFTAIEEFKDTKVLSDLRKIVRNEEYYPKSPKEIAGEILVTWYMGTKNSSSETLKRAKNLAEDIGCQFYNWEIDDLFDSTKNLFGKITGKEPKFEVEGGSYIEDLALQNIQARQRMVLAYLMAQLSSWVRDENGFLLVLGTANLDEGLRGYMTKYDCSSADINPIGGINKNDLKLFLEFCKKALGYESLQEILEAKPSAELRPIEDKSKDSTQVDEEEMGMTYDELNQFGRLRKIKGCGPVSMFNELLQIWKHLTPAEIGEKVKRFFFHYSVNRHKATTVTPSYFAENYGADENRFDHRQFLYNPKWTYQFKKMDKLIEYYTKKKQEQNGHK